MHSACPGHFEHDLTVQQLALSEIAELDGTSVKAASTRERPASL